MYSYYFDITISPEERNKKVISKVYQKLHQVISKQVSKIKADPAFINNPASPHFAIAFPHYNETKRHLGRKIRVFSNDQKALKALNFYNSLGSLAEKVKVYSVNHVPDGVTEYANYFRVRVKNNKERLARRKAKRENSSFSEAVKALGDFEPRRTKSPYLEIKSSSNKQYFRMPIGCRYLSAAEALSYLENKAMSSYGFGVDVFLPVFK